jgi:hypothetical protein
MTTEIQVWTGDAALTPLLVDIATVDYWPGNPRQGDVGAIVESLRRFGQLKPIVVQDSSGYVVAGNHVLAAAHALGWSAIAVVRSPLSDADARAFLVADNRLSELGTYDEVALTELLRELAVSGDLVATGYDGDDVDAMIRRLFPEAPTEFVEFDASLETDFRCPKCGHAWSGAPK